MSHILVLNSGSSSLKYRVFSTGNLELVAKGICERVGLNGGANGGHTYHPLTDESKGLSERRVMKDHAEALRVVLSTLVDGQRGILENISQIDAVGHRVVHGGQELTQSVVIDDTVEKIIEETIPLAPLHNPANLLGIRACKVILPQTPMVACFDTSFHAQMPEVSYTYAIPYELAVKHKIRVYGFHGLSHQYVSQRAAAILKRDDLRIMSLHLGNGSSVCAVKGGKSLSTSMGFTPTEGLIMGTRTGDLDPEIVLYLMRQEGLSVQEADDLLNRKSGLLGVSGVSNDMRDILREADAGNQRAKLAFNLYCYRVARYTASGIIPLEGLDAVVFTAGLGENQARVRSEICRLLRPLGVKLSVALNENPVGEAIISEPDSEVTVLRIPTNEELVIAREAKRLLFLGEQNEN
jgi:acetate kinase